MTQEESSKAKTQTRVVIRNIGLLLSGDLAHPILDADTILAVDGKITAVGKEKDVDSEGAALVVDAKGTAVAPGLIDSHVHPVAGDWTPDRINSGGSTAICTAASRR